MRPYTIRLAVSEDAADIAWVQTLSWKSTYAGIIEDAFLGALDADKKAEWWAKAISQGMTAYVAEVDGKIIGFATGGKGRKPINNMEGELYAIYILKNHQGSEVGKSLFRSVIDHLLSHSISSMFVWVLKDNPSKDFYIKLGGKLITTKSIKIGEQELLEEAYGWKDISIFAL